LTADSVGMLRKGRPLTARCGAALNVTDVGQHSSASPCCNAVHSLVIMICHLQGTTMVGLAGRVLRPPPFPCPSAAKHQQHQYNSMAPAVRWLDGAYTLNDICVGVRMLD
jgi:hypothetical protein